jgi:small subunit ribosomal protein S9
MAEDERKETSEVEGDTPEVEGDTPEVEGDAAQDEGAAASGPVAGEGASPSQAAGEAPTPTPPAEDASGVEAEKDQAPEEEPAAEPAAEQEERQAEADKAEGAQAEEEKAEEPEEARGKERKKDVIPGADLEPIAVEPEQRPLSAEEQARREAEEEERREREAALAGAEEEPRPASREPAKIEGGSRYLATGKRKHSIARVTLLPGGGEFVVNGRPLEEFFPRPLHQTTARQPLATTGYEGSVDVRVRVRGGGVSGQAGAVRHGIARALTEVDPDLRTELKRRGYLTRDARVKERRKAGLKKARKRPQFSKR